MRIKFIITTILVFYRLTFVYAQEPVWQWAKITKCGPLNNSPQSSANDVKCDAAGNIYVTGTFSNTVYFDSIELTSAGGSDIFIAGYDANGKVLWAKSYGGTSGEAAYGLFLDEDSIAWICGYAQDSAEPGTYPTQHIFVAAYNTQNGMLLKDHRIGEENDSIYYGNAMSYAISIDKNKNIFLRGSSGDGDLGGEGWSLGSFIAKYDSSFRLLWVSGIAPENEFNYPYNGTAHSSDVVFESDGTCLDVGAFSGTCEVQGVIFSADSNSTEYNGYMAKYEPDGGYLQNLTTIHGRGNQLVFTATGVDSNTIYISGIYQNNCIFNNSDTLSNPNPYDFIESNFLAKTNRNGKVSWAKNIKNTTSNSLPIFTSNTTTTANLMGDIIMMGNGFYNVLYIDDDSFEYAGENYFIVEYDENGNLQWLKANPANKAINYMRSTTDPANNFIVCGSFSGSLNFDSVTLQAKGPNDIFIAKLAISSASGIVEPKPEIVQMKLLPNPNNGSFRVSLQPPPVSQTYSLRLSDISGRLIASYSLPKGRSTEYINSNLTQGTYLLELADGNQILATKKMIVIR